MEINEGREVTEVILGGAVTGARGGLSLRGEVTSLGSELPLPFGGSGGSVVGLGKEADLICK